ncbi:hypothetical protein DFH06DRAFT_1391137 [Mycena polygramma]|nr:hypothetical protein DFH06DRAFT_1391137 [Mycena polygramma]
MRKMGCAGRLHPIPYAAQGAQVADGRAKVDAILFRPLHTDVGASVYAPARVSSTRRVGGRRAERARWGGWGALGDSAPSLTLRRAAQGAQVADGSDKGIGRFVVWRQRRLQPLHPGQRTACAYSSGRAASCGDPWMRKEKRGWSGMRASVVRIASCMAITGAMDSAEARLGRSDRNAAGIALICAHLGSSLVRKGKEMTHERTASPRSATNACRWPGGVGENTRGAADELDKARTRAGGVEDYALGDSDNGIHRTGCDLVAASSADPTSQAASSLHPRRARTDSARADSCERVGPLAASTSALTQCFPQCVDTRSVHADGSGAHGGERGRRTGGEACQSEADGGGCERTRLRLKASREWCGREKEGQGRTRSWDASHTPRRPKHTEPLRQLALEGQCAGIGYATLLRFPGLDARAERRCRIRVVPQGLLAAAELMCEGGRELEVELRLVEQGVEMGGTSEPGMRKPKPPREAQREREGVESKSLTLTVLESRSSADLGTVRNEIVGSPLETSWFFPSARRHVTSALFSARHYTVRSPAAQCHSKEVSSSRTNSDRVLKKCIGKIVDRNKSIVQNLPYLGCPDLKTGPENLLLEAGLRPGSKELQVFPAVWAGDVGLKSVNDHSTTGHNVPDISSSNKLEVKFRFKEPCPSRFSIGREGWRIPTE